jgi:predicted transcriptional regulator
MKTEKFGNKRNSADRAIALFRDGHTVDAIADALNMGEAEVEGALRKEGLKSRGKITLECTKTGRFWNVYSERAAYLKAQTIGLTEYTWGPAQ